MNSPATEQGLVAELRRLARDTEVPPPAPGSERALLAAFDAAWEQPRHRPPDRRRSYWPAAAAMVALAATIAWMVAQRPARVPLSAPDVTAPLARRAGTAAPSPAPSVTRAVQAAVQPAVRPHLLPDRTPRTASRRTTDFVVWPGATGLPTFESGHLMRVDMPTPIVLSLGLVPPAPHAAAVRADVLVGQDGLPRAVRLAP
jgi:hypothetical protein